MTAQPPTRQRRAHVTRRTKETQIDLSLNLDGAGQAEIDSPVGFLNHMLNLLARRFVGRLALSRTELVVVFAMMLVGAAIPRSSALCDVHLPVPFCPALSRIRSTRGRPVSSSFRAKMSAVISIRYEFNSPSFHFANTSCSSAALRFSPYFIMK